MKEQPKFHGTISMIRCWMPFISGLILFNIFELVCLIFSDLNLSEIVSFLHWIYQKMIMIFELAQWTIPVNNQSINFIELSSCVYYTLFGLMLLLTDIVGSVRLEAYLSERDRCMRTCGLMWFDLIKYKFNSNDNIAFAVHHQTIHKSSLSILLSLSRFFSGSDVYYAYTKR